MSERADGRPAVVLTLGKFDGVHAGHRHLLAHVIAEADRLGVRPAALVLHPDPATVLAGRDVPLLTPLATRLDRLRAFGVEIVEPLRFTRRVADRPPDAFVDDLAGRFALRGVVVGSDFAFGKGRQGDAGTLRTIGRRRGFSVQTIGALTAGGARVGSGLVRGMVADGEVDGARTLLRAAPMLVGTVIHGAARGRELGYPTANLDLTEHFVVPANGIYTVRARWPDGPGWVDGVASIGVRPTFDDGPRSVEVHLLDFEGDLYGRRLTVELLMHQRPEERFASAGELVEQMRRDVELAARRLDLERAAPFQRRADGRLAIRGHDLAALFEHAAAAPRGGASEPRGHRAGTSGDGPHRGAPDAGTRRAPVVLEAADDRSLLEDWLAHLSDPGVRRARVYLARGGRLEALVGRAGAAADRDALRAPAGATVHSGPARRADGFWEAVVTARAPEDVAAGRPPAR